MVKRGEDRLTVSQQLGDEWSVEMVWHAEDVQGGPAELTIKPLDAKSVPTGGLSSTVLRDVDFRKAAGVLRSTLNALEAPRGQLSKSKAGITTFDILREALGEGITDEYLALLSMEYLGMVTRGKEKPVERIAEELGKSPGTIKGHLWQARKRQFITGGSAGRKGGQLAKEAVDIAHGWTTKHIPRVSSSTT